MKRIFCSLLVVALPFGSVLADAPKSKNVKETLVYQHELPNVPGRSIKGVLVEYGPGGYSAPHTHPKSAFIYATVLEGEILSQVNKGPVRTHKTGQNFSELPGDRHDVSVDALVATEMKFGNSIPSGTYVDMAVNLPLVDPKKVLSPVLMTRGEWDGNSTNADLLDFFSQLPNGDRQYVILPNTAHSEGLSKNRELLWYAIKNFLKEPASVAA